MLTIADDIIRYEEAERKTVNLISNLKKSEQGPGAIRLRCVARFTGTPEKNQTFSELSVKSLEDTDALKKYLAKINSSAIRMTELIKAVLNTAGYQMPTIFLNPHSLNSVLLNISSDLELLINEKGYPSSR